MARPKSPNHDDNRRRILVAARALVVEGGHAALSLRQVARDAGFSPAGLYEYFDGRQAILDALAREASISLHRALDRAARVSAEQELSADEVLVAIGVAYVAWSKRHREDFQLLFSVLPSKRSSLDEAVPRPEEGSPYRVLLDAVLRAQGAGVVRGRDAASAERVAYGLWAAVHGMAMLQSGHLAGFSADFEAADRATLAALIAGFGR
jgi:AcrR family transcriptional regulator